MPAPWAIAGQTPSSYQAGIDNVETSSGKGAKFIRYAQGDGKGWGTLMQQFSAERYAGQRLRFQAKVKTREVDGWAGLWMRIDTQGRRSEAFYNSADKPISGTTGWQIRSVTLDVPDDASVISFGVIDAGTGQVWLDELTLEAVGKEVPVDVMERSKMPQAPTL